MKELHKRLSNVDLVEQIIVIKVVSLRGMGTTEYPIEQIVEYFLPDGTRLARVTRDDNPEELHKWTKK